MNAQCQKAPEYMTVEVKLKSSSTFLACTLSLCWFDLVPLIPSCSLLLQLGFFGIVGIPLFRAITELFKDAQPMMDGEQHHSCVCACT